MTDVRKCDHERILPNGSIVCVRVNGNLMWVGCRWCGRKVGKILDGEDTNEMPAQAGVRR